jgi:glycogen(starch) synthase
MRIAVVAFHPLASDSRVLRTAQALHEAGHEVVLVGHGPPPAGAAYRVALLPDLPSRFAVRAGLVLRQAPATLVPASSFPLYWTNAARRQAREILRACRPDAVHANDWTTLPLALDAKRRWGARIVYDSHEMAVAEFEHSLKWRLAARSHVRTIEARGIARADAVIAVSPGIARALQEVYPGLRSPEVIRNLPEAQAMPFRPTGPSVTVLFHGLLCRNRGLEAVLASLPHWPEAFRLVLRGSSSPAYRTALEAQIAARGLSRRVRFEPPVAPAEVVSRAAEADLGLCILPDSSRQNRFALPNKLFEYLTAGLGVVASPLPDMAQIVRSHGCGVLAAAEPGAIAAAMRALDLSAIDRLKRQAVAAAQSLTWAHERRKLVALYDGLPRP